jgi:hypothetical protein
VEDLPVIVVNDVRGMTSMLKERRNIGRNNKDSEMER